MAPSGPQLIDLYTYHAAPVRDGARDRARAERWESGWGFRSNREEHLFRKSIKEAGIDLGF